MGSAVYTMVRVVGVVLVLTGVAGADVFHMAGGRTSLEFVTVGNPGNPPDTRYSFPSGSTYYHPGSVAYKYEMGKFEVTAGQYTEFLNAVAGEDTYGLYNPLMWTNDQSCKIEQMGIPGSYRYRVADDRANRAVDVVSWANAARFCNWLANGQPTGRQDNSTTEDGSYFLNGTIHAYNILRKPNARYVIPSEDEWYKAGSYEPEEDGYYYYWAYATRSDDKPSNVLSATGSNNANYYDGYGDKTYTLGAPYWRTEVGAFAGSASFYGTFDQSGNVLEWTEMYDYDWDRAVMGGCYGNNHLGIHVHSGVLDTANSDYPGWGFRIAEVPEPSVMVMLALSGMGVLARGRRTAG